MTTREIDIQKNESIKLPKGWKSGKAYIFEDEDTLIVKKVQTPDFSYVRQKLRKLKNKISQKDIDQAIKAARS